MQSVFLILVNTSLSLIMDRTAAFYSRPSHDFRGGSFNVFAGSRRQRGGSIFGTLKNMFMPVAKTLGPAALAAGVGLAQDVMRDKASGKSFKDAMLQHGRKRGLDLAKTAAMSLAKNSMMGKLAGMLGKGSRRAGRRRKTVRRLRRKGLSRPRRRPRRRRQASRKTAPSRKRQKRAKSAPKRHAKRRRVAANF